MSPKKILSQSTLCLLSTFFISQSAPAANLDTGFDIDQAGLENLEKKLGKVPRFNYSPKGRQPANKMKGSWVPTGKVHANMSELSFGFEDNRNGDELYFKPRNPSKWMTSVNYKNDEGTQVFQKLGSLDKEAISFKVNTGSISGVMGTEFVLYEDYKEVKSSKGEQKMLPIAKVYDLKTKKEIQTFDCSSLNPESMPASSYASIQVAYVDQKWKAHCMANYYNFDDAKGTYSTFNFYYKPGEKEFSSKFETRNDKFTIVLPFESYRYSAQLFTNNTMVLSEDYGIGKEPKKIGEIGTVKVEAGKMALQNQWINKDLLAIMLVHNETGEGEVFFWQPKKNKFLETKLPVNTNGNSSLTYSISPDGTKLLLSDSKYKIRLYDVGATKLTEISIVKATSIPVGASTEVIKMTAQEEKTLYAKAQFLPNSEDGSWQFVSFMEQPAWDGSAEKQVTKRARLRYYKLNSKLKLETGLIKGSEGAVSASRLDFGVSDQLMVHFHNRHTRVFNYKTLTMLPKTRIARFRSSHNIGHDVLNHNGAIVQQSYTPVHWDDIDVVSESPKMIDELLSTSKSFCERSIPSNSRWLKIPMPTDQSPQVGEDTLKALKLRFQKPTGLNINTDLKTIMYLFEQEKIADEEPETASLILSNILYHSELLFEYLVKNYAPLKFKKIRELDTTATNFCLSAAEKSALQARAQQYLLDLLSRDVNEYEGEMDLPTKTVKVDQLLHYFGLVLKPLLYLSDKAAAEDAADKMASALADKTKYDAYFKHIFFSKLYKFAYKFASPFYGLKAASKLDYTIARLGGDDTYPEEGEGEPIAAPSTLTGLLMATGTFSASGKDAAGKQIKLNAQRSGYGFYFINTGTVELKKGDYKEKTEMTLPELMAKPKIEFAGVAYHGDLVASYLADKKIIPTETKFPTAASQNASVGDGSFTGLMMFGYDLGDEEYIFDEYQSFYKDRGYKFKPAEIIPDIKAWATEKIEKDQLDYLLKEAHSDGDEKNLFQFYNKVKILHGQKGSGTKKEDIYLTFPMKDENSSPLLWPNNEFGAAVNKRKLPFTYLNTSCWSVSKAPFEIQEAQNAKFYNVASVTMVDTFYNQEDSAMFQLIRGLLEAKDFESVRGEKYLGMNKENVSGESNVYIFPGQDEYKEQVESKLTIPVSVDIKLFNSTTKKEVEITDLH